MNESTHDGRKTSRLVLSPEEQAAVAAGADVSQYIGYRNNGRPHEEAIVKAGGKPTVPG